MSAVVMLLVVAVVTYAVIELGRSHLPKDGV